MIRPEARRPLIVHVLHRLDVGGLENGVVNLINHLPADAYRHAIVCLTDYTDFRQRLQDPAVRCCALHRRSGKDWRLYPRLWRCFRSLRPALVHTRNLATLEAQLPAWLAGAPARVHGEHGWDMADMDGSRYRRLRAAFRPLIHDYVGLSRHIADYLTAGVGVPRDRVTQIYNGVDTERFYPARERDWVRERFGGDDVFVVGTVGRLEAVKHPLLLARAVRRLADTHPGLACQVRLVFVGEGSERPALKAYLEASGLAPVTWLAGNRDDVPALLRGFDTFVLPSRAEGVSNTLLEAMASGLPVVATAVGGNPELIREGETGCCVAEGDERAMAGAIARLVADPACARLWGAAGRRRVEARFSLVAMVDAYDALYRRLLTQHSGAARNARVDRVAG
ncbi:TIGR03088 family PEP-CTERM/XrtA system glycosyltransferase [Arhodomonas sp. SL1]|uniref:TIGR03088 family PEP-CTERM/XrtA system glycosyltransferase n=1 Tax=Arhodomonas sp. SL1 TaxID=3425691 RepID=UPI003F8817C4